MRKKTLYVLISIFTLICFFGTAALCNQFGGEDEDEAPTIKLEIAEGPVFSEEDQVCYYEIEAVATGIPEPDIEFTLDDNVSLLAAEKAKVVINDSSDSYTLEATATNSAGSTTASINLSWGCEEEIIQEEETEDTEEVTLDEEELAEEIQEVEVLDEDHFATELSIYIQEGPVYSAADDVCYYRIASELYGNPFPELNWSKDDSNGAFGNIMVQVNLRRGETYTLTATATNYLRTVTQEITLSWGCDEADAADGGDGESIGEGEEIELVIPIIGSESGTIFGDRGVSPGPVATAGDIFSNEPQKGFISFDISMVPNVNITHAILDMDGYYNGDISFYNKFWINSIYWGPNSIDNVNREILTGVGVVIQGFPASGYGDIICSNEVLLAEIQKAIDENKPRFQIRIHFSGPLTDNDGAEDNWIYSLDNTSLKIRYTS